MRLFNWLAPALCLAVSSALAQTPQPTTVAKASASASSSVATSDVDEKAVTAMGYKLEVRNGQRLFCRAEDTTGTRLQRRSVCSTAKLILDRQKMDQENLKDTTHSAKGVPTN